MTSLMMPLSGAAAISSLTAPERVSEGVTQSTSLTPLPAITE